MGETFFPVPNRLVGELKTALEKNLRNIAA
jgi:hypothetical protein